MLFTITITTKTYAITSIDEQIERLGNNTLREVFENTSLFDTYQLVSNGDFNNGTSGWTASTNTTGFSVSNGIMQFEKTGADSYIYELMTISVSKYYMIYRAKSPSNTFNMNLSGTYTLNHSGSDTFEIISQVVDVTSNLTAVRLQTGAVGVNYVDYAYLFNISTLIENKQYSPLYKTTFDLMIDAQIKAQMDEFVNKPYLFIDYEDLGIENISSDYMTLYYEIYCSYPPNDHTQWFLVKNNETTVDLYQPSTNTRKQVDKTNILNQYSGEVDYTATWEIGNIYNEYLTENQFIIHKSFKAEYNKGYETGLSLTNLTSKEAWELGYARALIDNQAILEQEKLTEYWRGFDEGKQQGLIEGSLTRTDDYNKGYEKALEDLNSYSAIVPKTVGAIWLVISDFLSIEILGISLWEVLGTFALIGIILLVLKLIL